MERPLLRYKTLTIPVIQRLTELPPLPVAARMALRTADNPECDTARLATAVERDPPLTARVLQHANNATFAGMKPATNIRNAIARMGLEHSRQMVITAAMSAYFTPLRRCTFDICDYWRSALRVATGARAVAGLRYIPLTDDEREAAYAAGLLHNIGRLAIAHILHGEILGLDLTNEEETRRALGIGPVEAGLILLKAWKLPDIFIHTLEYRYGDGAIDRGALPELIGFLIDWEKHDFLPAHVPGDYPALPDAAIEHLAATLNNEESGIARWVAMLAYC